MKHLKKYNEELKDWTYKQAAEKLKKLGHERRSKELEDWREIRKQQEQEKREKSRLERLSKFPSFQMEVRLDSWNPNTRSTTKGTESVVKGNFYVDIDCAFDMIDDHIYWWLESKMNDRLSFMLDMGIIPADEEAKKSLNDAQDRLSEEIWDNALWGSYLLIYLTEKGKDLNDSTKIEVELESRENNTIIFSTRRDALKFKRLLVAHFEGKNNFGGGSTWAPDGPAPKLKELFKGQEKYYTDIENIEDREGITWIKDKYNIPEDSPIKAEHYQKLVDAIKRMSVNDLYRD